MPPAVASVPVAPADCLSSTHRARILMVDDHHGTSIAMKRLLSGLGYDVRIANSVQSALSVADLEPFDVLISDIGLPDGTGLDLMRELKSRSGSNQSVKAIALSGFGMEDDVRKSLAAGFREHLTKPVNLQKLQELIEKMVG